MTNTSMLKLTGLALVMLAVTASGAQAVPLAKLPGGAQGSPYATNPTDNVFLAGGQAGGQRASYGYAGVVSALPGSEIGNGWVQRIFAEEVTYRYKKGRSTIDADGYGGSLTYGYQHTYNGGWFGAYAGPAYRYTKLSPVDRASDARGSNVTARFAAEAEQYLGEDFKLNELGNYDAFGNNGYWGRLRALFRVSGTTYFGPEGVYQGDNDYKAWQAGLAVVGIPITEDAAFGIDGGVRKTDSDKMTGYGGLELGVNF